MHDQWVTLLGQLANQLGSGGIYARDLPGIRDALDRVERVYEMRAARH